MNQHSRPGVCTPALLLQVGIQIHQAVSPTSARLSRKHCCSKLELNFGSGKRLKGQLRGSSLSGCSEDL